MKAIDLYSGVGGWSLGLRCAGIEVVESYEIWPTAVATYNANLGANRAPRDVRELSLASLPTDVSLVVGSPPCTEFSLANRGGQGDVAEGLKDIAKFLEIVQYLKPRYWIMENVPRTAGLIREGFATRGHALYRYRSLAPEIHLFNLSEFGLPQARVRCFVGSFPFQRLLTLGASQPRRTLGAVIDALSSPGLVSDPIWPIELRASQVTEMEPEPPLTGEQFRMNREAKRFHPVYNDMPFPDALERPARTVTATCTRVSRESIVVGEGDGPVRRLTVRERASLQGFPLTYQFYAKSHSQKIKMIGNAVPPLFSYLAGVALSEHEADPSKHFHIPTVLPDVTPPHAVASSFPAKRRFRAVVPGLRFKSGMRVQLENKFDDGAVNWNLEFVYGPSKAFTHLHLDRQLYSFLAADPCVALALTMSHIRRDAVAAFVGETTPQLMQEVWRKGDAQGGPYQLLDLIGQASLALTSAIAATAPDGRAAELVLTACRQAHGEPASKEKLVKNALSLLAGMLLGSWFNSLPWAATAEATMGSRSASFTLDKIA